MPLQNTFTLDVDFKQSNYINEPVVTQNDEVTFILNVYNNGLEFDLSDVSTYTIASFRPDKQSVMTIGTKTGTNQITFALGSTEISVVGKVYAAIQLYDADGRVSTLPFTYKVLKDPLKDYVPSVDEKTLIELVLGEGPSILAAAEQITAEATEAEAFRAAAESERVIAETERISSELARATAEDERVTNETTRIDSENARKTAEDTRIQSENERETNTSTAIQNVELATTDAVNATEAINLVLPNVLNLEYIAQYNATTQYLKNNIVRKDKNSYIALQNTLGNEPTGTTDSQFWGVIAVGGIDGTGSVVTVNGVSPDANGNVSITIPNPDLSGLATKDELQGLEGTVTTHLADYLKHTGYAVTTGSANTYIATLNPALSAYAEGVSLRLKINVANTGASTVNVNGLGTKSILKSNGSPVASGNLKVGSIYTLAYDGTSFILQGEGGEYGNVTADKVLLGTTFGTETGVIPGTMNLQPHNIKQGINYGGIIGTVVPLVSLGDTVVATAPTKSRSSASVTPVSLGGFIISHAGDFRISYTVQGPSVSDRPSVYFQVYKNNVAVGVRRTLNFGQTLSFTEDFTVDAGDRLEIRYSTFDTTTSNGTLQIATLKVKDALVISVV